MRNAAMKLQKKIDLEFAAIRGQYGKIKAIAARTSARHLWQQESAVRERIKSLIKMRQHPPEGFDDVYRDYVALLEELSLRILGQYNEQHNTAFRFQDVIRGHFKAYLRTGVLSVLMTSHIPQLLSDSFNRCLPANPKDEYPDARAMRRHFILHLGETNTGKTYQAIRRLITGGQGAYLAPLRVLALENYEWMNTEGALCNLLTGEEEILIEGARLVSCTIEKLNLETKYQVAVIDEAQMLADSRRGAAWAASDSGTKLPGNPRMRRGERARTADPHDRRLRGHIRIPRVHPLRAPSDRI